MRICVKSDLDGRVAELPLDCLDALAVRDHETRTGVPKIVKANLSDAGLSQ